MSRKPPQHITFGDLVSIDGYDGHLYFVDCWTVEHCFFPDEQFTEVWYDVTDAHTGEYQMAEAHDITRICGADQADDYLRNSAKPKFDVGNITVNISEILFGEGPKMKSNEQRKPSARELSGIEAERRKQARKDRAEQIDNLLDIRNWNAKMYEKTSEKAYRTKIEEIDAELTELVAEGSR